MIKYVKKHKKYLLSSSGCSDQEKVRAYALYQQTIGMLAHSAAKAEADEAQVKWMRAHSSQVAKGKLWPGSN